MRTASGQNPRITALVVTSDMCRELALRPRWGSGRSHTQRRLFLSGSAPGCLQL